MKKIIQELRVRGVLRAAGLYLAFTWLLLQIGEVLFPAFDIPDAAIRYLFIGAIAGFPVAMLVSWFFDISSAGIRTEEEVREAGEKRSRSLLSTATIVILVMALGVSLYANYQQASNPGTVSPPSRVSLLVADFTNTTGDSVFEGAIESALVVELEGAAFVDAFSRNTARELSDAGTLDDNAAGVVAAREGIELVVSGMISADGAGYLLEATVNDPRTQEVIAEAQAVAGDRTAVFSAAAQLAAQIREQLGDQSQSPGDAAAIETFATSSVEAVHYYSIAQRHAHALEYEQASEFYEKAIAEDPNFGRAYSGWALATHHLGRVEDANALWQKTLGLIDGMRERERYRTLGVYYLIGSGNTDKAIENYKILIEKYPADSVARNNLAVSYAFARQFDKALGQGAEIVGNYPGNLTFQSNYMLYAMYAGQFELAATEAEKLLEADKKRWQAYLAQAIAALAEGKPKQAEKLYKRMAKLGDLAELRAYAGRADAAFLAGDPARASKLLQKGIELAQKKGNALAQTWKQLYLAHAENDLGNAESALQLLEQVLATSEEVEHLLPAALLLIDMGEFNTALEVQARLEPALPRGSRSAAAVIRGVMAMTHGEAVAAVDAFNQSLDYQDNWLARFYLGRAYADAGYFAEALGEFEKAEDRIGETAALFLNEVPTFHYSAPLYYWLAFTKQQLGMRGEALENYQKYLSYRDKNDASPNTLTARAQVDELEL